MLIDLRKLDEELQKNGYPVAKHRIQQFSVPEMTAYDFFERNSRLFSGSNCFDFMFNKIKFDEVREKIDESAKAFSAFGISDRDRIGTLLPNIPETAFIQYGLSKIGAITDHIDPRTNPLVIKEFVRSENLKTLVVVDVLYDYTIKPIERELKYEFGVDKIIVVPTINSIHPLLKAIVNMKQFLSNKKRITSDVLDIYYWDKMIKESKYQFVTKKEYVPNETSLIVHSSGTSSAMPKGIPLTNENLNSIVVKHQISDIDFQPGMRFLHILPYFAAYGSVNSAHLALNLGMELIEIPEFKFENFGMLLLKYKPNIVLGVPNWWKLLTKDPRMQNKDLSFLKIAVAGGDSINSKEEAEINDFFKKHGANCVLTKGHGMSELSGCGSFTFDGSNNLGGMGEPFPTDRYVLLDSNGHIIPFSGERQSGEAYIYSPTATPGIIDGRSIVTIKYIAGFPFIETKDFISLNSDMTMNFEERIDRTFTRFDGYKVRPSNIESVIESFDEVQECMVVEYEDDENMGKMPIAHIVLKKDLSREEKYELIKKIINEKMLKATNFTSRDIPKKWKFRQSIPQTLMSKNDYRSLIAEGLSGEEYTCSIRESNLQIENINITMPEEPIKLKLK